MSDNSERVRKSRPPMPSDGGSYRRQGDGSLELVERTAPPKPGSAGPDTAETEAPAVPSGSRKRALKEA